VEIQTTGCALLPRVEGEPLHRPTIRAALDACSTITTARIIGGTERRLTSVNRSANISSGNPWKTI